MKSQWSGGIIVLAAAADLATARSLWSSKPATHAFRASKDYLLKTGYAVGNGRLGAIPHGPPGNEGIILSVDSLWSGGPFNLEDYRGGNPTSPLHSALPEIRSEIFQNGTGSVAPLLGNGDGYGAYQTLGNLTITYDGFGEYDSYRRELDLETGIHTTVVKTGDTEISTSVYCSYPDEVCIYHITSNEDAPEITIGFENRLIEPETAEFSCGEGHVRVKGVAQVGPPEGLRYDAVARVTGCSGATTSCSDDSKLTITAPEGKKSLTVVVGAGTNFDQTKGNAENDYSFKGPDPSEYVETITEAAAAKNYKSLYNTYLKDYQRLGSAFVLDLPDTHGSADKETSSVIEAYTVDGSGDPYLEGLLFDYSRHLLITSSRPGSLPANLQGRWTEELWPAWSADYHANINLQMNYWVADQTGLSETQDGLWDYMELNWVPRGTETAKLLYDADGWVVHNEMNIYGFTAMKNGEGWAHYPAAPAWMMQHVWDNYEYTQDADWFKRQGYPLIKGVAEFWLSQLQEDGFFEDGSLVVNPCSSPEHGPTTFGCAHYQQEIHRTFDTVLSGAPIVGEEDEDFVVRVAEALKRLDKGFKLSGSGEVKEWKLPDSYTDGIAPRHRHLSHLTGWHPGYSVSGYLGGYTNQTIQSAVEKTLIARGNGNAPDANSGWAKVWRSAAWARLNNTEESHWHLRYAIEQNFVGNGFSMYSGLNEPFQIDANFGFGGAVLSMLVVDLPFAHDVSPESTRTVVLGPAIPPSWAGGSVKGLRLRGGGTASFSWDDDGVVNEATVEGPKTNIRLVNVKGDVLT